MVSMAPGIPLRVLLMDRDDIARAGVRALVLGDTRFNLVYEQSEIQVEPAVVHRPDIIVLDPADRRRLDPTLVSTLTDTVPDSRLCVYTDLTAAVAFLQAMEYGAHAYLCKGTAGGAFLLETLFVVGHFDAVVIDPAIIAVLPRQLGAWVRLAVATPMTEVLSARERQVLASIAQGETDQEIGRKLAIRPSTVDSYVARLCDKLHAGNRPHLVDTAWRRGLLRV